MNYSRTLLALLALALAGTAVAGDKPRMAMSIAVIDDETQEEVRVDLDSDTLGFDMKDMQVGENRAVVDKNGQNVLITREEDGYRYDVNGRTIRTALHHGRVHDHVAPLPPLPRAHGGPKGIVIVSGEPIDDATQRAIQDLLKAAGHDSEVRFMDGRAGHGRHEVRIIEKRVDAER